MSESLPLRRIDHVRFFVGNARQSAYFYRNAFGFDVVAYAGLETRQKHEAGYVLRQGHITFVLVSPLSPQHPESGRLLQHGDGVQDIALEVADVPGTFHEAVRRGATAVHQPTTVADEFGIYESATIRAYGNTTHSFVNRDNYHGVFSPGFKPIAPERYSAATFKPVGLKAIDHVVGNVEEGKVCRSPIAGVVVRVTCQMGQTIQANDFIPRLLSKEERRVLSKEDQLDIATRRLSATLKVRYP